VGGRQEREMELYKAEMRHLPVRNAPPNRDHNMWLCGRYNGYVGGRQLCGRQTDLGSGRQTDLSDMGVTGFCGLCVRSGRGKLFFAGRVKLFFGCVANFFFGLIVTVRLDEIKGIDETNT